MELLEKRIEGKGVTAGYLYSQMAVTPNAYIYEVLTPFKDVRFDVFRRKTIPIRDFVNWNETGEVKEVYPSLEDFGSIAWHYMSDQKKEAMDRFISLIEKYDG